jgi:hypothetical protein
MQITIGRKHYHLGSGIIPDREGRGVNFDSESFEGLEYLVKEDHLIFKGKCDGLCAIQLSNIPDFVAEMMEIYKTYKD